jgi:hypothetical protein
MERHCDLSKQVLLSEEAFANYNVATEHVQERNHKFEMQLPKLK